jgi:uncharacterized alpha/beta hydrolase family protein
MDTKLTLKLEETIIEKAKEYAKNNKTSLSKLIENYLLNITGDKGNDEKTQSIGRISISSCCPKQ